MSVEVACTEIDVCMIVSDEAGVIGQSMSALLDAGFDSFTVIDMESRDDTVAHIQGVAGPRARIHTYPRDSLLKFGYAEARNTCASFARRHWVLFVDADEVLTGGCEAGRLRFTGNGAAPGLASIERRNLAREGGAADGALVTKSVERHQRLYVPSLTQRWKGYIHEEIHRGGVSGWDVGGQSGLLFDHHSALKPLASATERFGLYALMLLRAYRDPALQEGTNAWWYDSYVPEHYEMLKSHAAAYVRERGLTGSLSLPELTAGNGGPASGPLLRAISIDDPAETVLDLSVLRVLHSASSKPWTDTSDRVLWGEWNHPGEGARSLAGIIEATRTLNWQRFINPGQVCLDIGSHSGDTALPMALYAFDRNEGRRGQVVAVEPNPAVIPVLDVNLSMNTHLGDFYVVNAAVTTDDTDEVELADHGNAGCNGGLLAAGGLSAAVEDKLQSIAAVRYKTQGVSMATLLKEVAAVCRRPVGFIKIDCEGYDKEILRPCRELFIQEKPALFVEWFAWFTPEDDASLFDVIDSIGYLPFDPVTLQAATPSVRIPDLLCIHADDHVRRSTITAAAAG